MIAQNWNSRKPEIAFAQTYFASQTKKQEVYEQRNEENKRLEARAKLKKSKEKIEETVYNRWITLPIEFVTFKNKKIETLYIPKQNWFSLFSLSLWERGWGIILLYFLKKSTFKFSPPKERGGVEGHKKLMCVGYNWWSAKNNYEIKI